MRPNNRAEVLKGRACGQASHSEKGRMSFNCVEAALKPRFQTTSYAKYSG